MKKLLMTGLMLTASLAVAEMKTITLNKGQSIGKALKNNDLSITYLSKAKKVVSADFLGNATEQATLIIDTDNKTVTRQGASKAAVQAPNVLADIRKGVSLKKGKKRTSSKKAPKKMGLIDELKAKLKKRNQQRETTNQVLEETEESKKIKAFNKKVKTLSQNILEAKSLDEFKKLLERIGGDDELKKEVSKKVLKAISNKKVMTKRDLISLDFLQVLQGHVTDEDLKQKISVAINRRIGQIKTFYKKAVANAQRKITKAQEQLEALTTARSEFLSAHSG